MHGASHRRLSPRWVGPRWAVPRWVGPRWAAAVAVLVGATPAQDEATTLARLAERAAAVVIAQTDAVSAPAAGAHRIELRIERALKGGVAARLTLEEPAGQCCGRALHSLVAGRYVVFLAQSRGATRLASTGSRCVEPARPAVVRHLESWLRAATPAQRAAVLVEGLHTADPRVRRDAALTLPYLPGLEAAAAPTKQQLSAALAAALSGPSPARDDAVAARLTVAAVRLRLAAALPALVDAYLSGASEPLEQLLYREIPRLDAPAAASYLAERLPADAAGRQRAARLLAALPAAAARPPLLELFATAQPSTAACAGAALLERHGVDWEWLHRHGRAAVLDGIAELQRPRPPAFRSILRGSPR